MHGKQYQVIGQFERASRDQPMDLKSIYVRNNVGQLIQLDNIVSITESSNPPQLYLFQQTTCQHGQCSLAPGKTIGEGIATMEEIADKTLDDSFYNRLKWAFT